MTQDSRTLVTARIREIRAEISGLRRAIPKAVRLSSGEAARGQFLSAIFPVHAWAKQRVALYRALPDEFDLQPLEEKLEQAGAQLFFPHVVPHPTGTEPRQGLKWFRKHVHGGAWQNGVFGIQEPMGVSEPQDPAFDFIFVPGVAFGLEGERIGRGAGYYDRCLALQTTATRVAFALDEQIMTRLPQNPWDQRVDWIFTPTRAIQTQRVVNELI